jgi:hypothetical protein
MLSTMDGMSIRPVRLYKPADMTLGWRLDAATSGQRGQMLKF